MDVLPLGLAGDGLLRAAVAADREVNRMAGVRMDHLAEYLTWAAESWVPPRATLPGVEHLVQLGGPGTVRVPEFTVCEVATSLGLSQPAASGLCADVLDLAGRLRVTAQGVRSGLLEWGRARLIARRTRELSVEQAVLVEASVMRGRDTARGRVPVAALVPWGRLVTMLDQAVLRARGPETVAEAEQRVAQSLFVELYRTEAGATDVAARLAAADATRLDQRLDQIAGWLTQVGDDRPKPVLRAVAMGLLADPAMLKALDGLRKEQSRDTSAGEVRSGARTPHPYRAAPSPPDPLPESDEPPAPDELTASYDLVEPAEPAELDEPGEFGAPVGMGLGGADPPQDSGGLGLGGGLASRDIANRSRPAGVAGLPPPVLEKLAGLTSTVLYLHLDQASGTWCQEGARSGALSHAQARAIVGHSTVLVRPILDAAGELTYTGYTVPPLLREQLALLNAGQCCFPGCSRRARLSQADHRDPHPGGRRGWSDAAQAAGSAGGRGGATGQTRSSNMQPLCTKHHRAKTHTRWVVISPARGIWVWTSPAGASYLVTNGVTTPLNATARAAVADRNRARVGARDAVTDWVSSGGQDCGYDHPADLTPAEAEVTYGHLDAG